jgi:predicted deacylase
MENPTMPLHIPASAGQRRWSGFVEPDPHLAIPCTVIRGRAPGPRLLVTAGVHGAEYSSIEAARRLTSLPPDDVVGELTILPIVNIGAFWNHQPYVNPLDGKNVNRVFPGNAKGSASERLAAWLTTTAMADMDGYVDLHCGDIVEALTPFAIFRDGDARSETLAIASGFPYVVRSDARGHSYVAAVQLGLPGVLLESGGNGLWTEDSVTRLTTGVNRIMTALGMRQDHGASGAPHPTLCRMEVTTAPASGFWHCAVSPGAHVKRGAALGVIYDLVGQWERRIEAEHSGPVLYHVTSLAITEGEPLVGIAI